jgi:hypothetical protein
MPPSSLDQLAARLGRAQLLIHDLAKIHGTATPVASAMADKITREIEDVRRELTGDGAADYAGERLIRLRSRRST